MYIDLTGLWRFQPDPFNEGEQLGWQAPATDVRFWREVRVPCVFDRCAPGMAGYEGAGWFRREVAIPSDWTEKRVELTFGAVNYHAKVWVNGRLVGEHADGFLPFTFIISDCVTPGETACIVVWADNERIAGEVPGLERGWRPYGGIIREVTLTGRDPLRLEGLVAHGNANGHFTVRGRIVNGRAAEAPADIRLIVTDAGGADVSNTGIHFFGLAPGESADLEDFADTLDEPHLWTPETPYLYTAHLTLSVDEDIVEEHTLRFGCRTVETRGEQLLLNGAPIFLAGCNRHEDSARTDACTDLAQAKADFLDMKAMGMNFVRLCHYPHSPGELELCDEIGLLAMCEIPLYWWNGLEEGEEACARKLEAAKRQLAALIARDAGHPSVFCWSVSNETREERPEVVEGNDALIRLAHALDPTRPAVHVTYHWAWDEPHFEEDDILCLNSYPTLAARAWNGHPEHTPAMSRVWWAEQLERLHARYPDKPILVTEFGLPAFETVRGSTVGEDLQVETLREEFAGMTAPYVCGAAVWCYADHPWPEEPFLNRVTTSPYGLLTRERRRKPAYNAVAEMFRARRGLPAPPTGVDDPENLSVGMYRPHMRDIPQFSFPDGYGVRALRPEDGPVWTDAQRDAEHWLEITDDLFQSEFGFDLEALAWRSFFIVNAQGAAVGAISAWYDRDIRGLDYGRIHWVCLRPAYRGLGLIKPAMTHAMNVLAQWHERAYLGTSTARVPAIKVYLDFGFLPDMALPGAEKAWRQLAERLDDERRALVERCIAEAAVR